MLKFNQNIRLLPGKNYDNQRRYKMVELIINDR